jgi:hypothetical protein
MTRRLAGFTALVALIAAPAWATTPDDRQPRLDTGPATETTADRGFRLDLDPMWFDAGEGYHLFAETRRAALQAPMARLERELYGPGFRGSPNLRLPPHLLTQSLATFDVGPGGRPQFKIFLSERRWGDLDPWEKVGLTMHYASALAAIGYLVAEAVD